MKRIVFLLVTLFMMGGMAMAQSHCRNHKRMTPKERAEKMTERMVKEYSLNNTQKIQLLELNLAQCEKMDKRMSKHSKRVGKKDRKKDGSETSNRRKEMREKMRAEMIAGREAYNAELQKIMTKDQYASYIKNQSERKQQVKERCKPKK